MFLGFYCIYPALRHFINGSILKGIRYLFGRKWKEPIWIDVTYKNVNPIIHDNKQDKQVAKKPKQSQNTEAEWDNGKNALIVPEDKLTEWLNKNPELSIRQQ